MWSEGNNDQTGADWEFLVLWQLDRFEKGGGESGKNTVYPWAKIENSLQKMPFPELLGEIAEELRDGRISNGIRAKVAVLLKGRPHPTTPFKTGQNQVKLRKEIEDIQETKEFYGACRNPC